MKTAIIIQARMSSTRLPGKIMRPLAGRPILEHVIQRALACRESDVVCVATTTDESDSITTQRAKEYGALTYRGAMNDVLGRYRQAAEQLDADIVVRITADCPMLDPDVIDATIRMYKDHEQDFDYAANDLTPTFPVGLGVEVLGATLLNWMDENVIDSSEREHVTLFIHRHPEDMAVLSLVNTTNISSFRLTIDVQKDYELAEHVFNSLDSDGQGRIFGIEEVVTLLAEKPEWVLLNSQVQQRIVSVGTGTLHKGREYFKQWHEVIRDSSKHSPYQVNYQ